MPPLEESVCGAMAPAHRQGRRCRRGAIRRADVGRADVGGRTGAALATALSLLNCFPAVSSMKLVRLADWEQGHPFNYCFDNNDWNTKTIYDEINVSDPLENGCCAKGQYPGQIHWSGSPQTSKPWGPQVICGFSGNQWVSTNADNCEYRDCYIRFYNLTCDDGTPVRLNGCCAEGKKCLIQTGCGYSKEGGDYCKFQAIRAQIGQEMPGEEEVLHAEICITEHSRPLVQWEGTKSREDDVVDSTLQVQNVYAPAACYAEVAPPANCSDEDVEDIYGDCALKSSSISAAPRTQGREVGVLVLLLQGALAVGVLSSAVAAASE